VSGRLASYTALNGERAGRYRPLGKHLLCGNLEQRQRKYRQKSPKPLISDHLFGISGFLPISLSNADFRDVDF
jgi:hypothetical protein